MGNSHSHLRETHQTAGAKERMVRWAVSRVLASARLSVVGESDTGPKYQMVRLRPVESHLLVTWGGRGRVWTGSQWELTLPGTAYLMPPGVPHAFETVGRTRWQFSWAFHIALPDEPPLIEAATPHVVPADPRPFRSAIEGLCHEAAGQAEPQVLDRWADLVRVYVRRLTDPLYPHDPLWQVWRAVERDPGAPWSMARLADLAAASEEHVRRLSLRSTGRSPMKHVTYLRMQRAAAMLASTSLKVAGVAAAVGYDSAFAFSTAFRRHLGCAPAEWRNSSLSGRPVA